MVEKAREALGVPLNRDLAACLLEMALLLNWKLWEKVVVTLV
jgi:hypothetical protein